MPFLTGISMMLDVAKENQKEKRVRELLKEKGFKEDHIFGMVWSMSYMWLDEKNKNKACRKANKTRKEVETGIELCYLIMFSQEDIAEVLISNKAKAHQAHIEAVETLKQMGVDPIRLTENPA